MTSTRRRGPSAVPSPRKLYHGRAEGKAIRGGSAVERLAGTLKGLIRARHPRRVWHVVNIPSLAKYLAVSERTLWRAKAYLKDHEQAYGLRFITLRRGRQWVLIVARLCDLRFDGLPLLRDANGHTRNVRWWLCGDKITRQWPIEPPATAAPAAPAEDPRQRSFALTTHHYRAWAHGPAEKRTIGQGPQGQ